MILLGFKLGPSCKDVQLYVKLLGPKRLKEYFD